MLSSFHKIAFHPYKSNGCKILLFFGGHQVIIFVSAGVCSGEPQSRQISQDSRKSSLSCQWQYQVRKFHFTKKEVSSFWRGSHKWHADDAIRLKHRRKIYNMKSSVVAFPMEYIPLSAPFFFHVDFYFLSILLSHGKNGKVEIFMRKTVADLEYTKGDTNSG